MKNVIIPFLRILVVIAIYTIWYPCAVLYMILSIFWHFDLRVLREIKESESGGFWDDGDGYFYKTALDYILQRKTLKP